MIALVRGDVVLRRPDHVVLDAGGVGYRLAVSAETLRHVPAVGRETTLLSHLVVRDDALELFGFATEEERDLFLLLLTVQAVGPKLALAVLSGGPPRDLLAALAAGDAARFQAVKGVGKKTAERIVVELRERVTPVASVGPGAGGHAGAGSAGTAPDDPRALARDGLLGLGFTAEEAEAMLRTAAGDTAEALIADALRGARR